MELLRFLLLAVGISLSGVMAPGAVTAATIAQGSRNRWAGTLISIGHGMIEIPLIFAIMLGLGALLEHMVFGIAIGLLGGGFLIWMGWGMLREMSRGTDSSASPFATSGSIMTGFVLSVSNPYFLVWWATVGLNLVHQARALGLGAFVLFAVVHWSCDFVWLTILSFGSFHGTMILGPRNQRIILGLCGDALLFFGAWFVSDALWRWLECILPDPAQVIRYLLV